MTVSEFNTTIAAAGESLILPPDLEVRIIRHEGNEVQILVKGLYRWIKKRRIKAHHKPREALLSESRPSYSMDKSDIALGPTAYFVLQWINSLQTPQFSLSYAETQLGLSRKTIRTAMARLIETGRIPPKEIQ